MLIGLSNADERVCFHQTSDVLSSLKISGFAEFMDLARVWHHDPQIWVGRILRFIEGGFITG
jgi:hypothetical protein